MNAAEYVVIFTSIVLGLALGAILTNFDRLLRAGRRVRWHWAPPLLGVLVVLLLIQIWWSLFPQGGAEMTIGAFLPQLGLLVLLFLLASAVLPGELPDEGLDLGDWYDRNGPYFWSLMTLTLGWTIGAQLAAVLFADASWSDFLGNRAVDIGVLLLFASLVFIRRRWWHLIVVAVAMVGPIGWLSRSIG